jgi:two-component system sensor histidine kinase/response regulator
LGKLVKAFGEQAKQKGLTFHWDIEPDVPKELISDPARIRQILLHLVGNAIKFTEGGEVQVRVTRESGTEGESYVRFTIGDTGIGIPADTHQGIFEPFSQSKPGQGSIFSVSLPLTLGESREPVVAREGRNLAR